jgi:hypothetical protein
MISIGKGVKPRASQCHRNILFPAPEMEDAADAFPG